jgi:hypothetical protein
MISMRQLSIPFILGLLLALILPPRLHAQTATTAPAATNPPAEINAQAVNPTPANQAPDEMTKKITDLVHDGKYAEAQELTIGLLVAYPNDPRLIKAKALIEKLLSPAGPVSAAPSSNQPTNAVATAQPTLNPSAESLTGMERVDYNALVELARQAQQTADLLQQNKLLQQFMDQSSPFLQKHPTQMLLWQLRGTSAMILNDPMAGYEAGEKLLAMGAADSNDSNLQRLLAQLKNKGWLDKQRAEDDEQTKRYSWIVGIWSVNWSFQQGKSSAQQGNAPNEEFFKSGSVIEGYNLYGGVKSSGPDLRGTILPSGEIRWERYLSPSGNTTFAFSWAQTPLARELIKRKHWEVYPSGWQPVISYEIVNDKKTMTMVVPSQDPSAKSKKPLEQPVTLSFTRIDSTH